MLFYTTKNPWEVVNIQGAGFVSFLQRYSLSEFTYHKAIQGIYILRCQASHSSCVYVVILTVSFLIDTNS